VLKVGQEFKVHPKCAGHQYFNRSGPSSSYFSSSLQNGKIHHIVAKPRAVSGEDNGGLWYAFYDTEEHPDAPPGINDAGWYYGLCKDFLTTNKQRMLVDWKATSKQAGSLIGRRTCCQFDDYKFYYGRVMGAEKRGRKLSYTVRYDDGVIRNYSAKQLLPMIRVELNEA